MELLNQVLVAGARWNWNESIAYDPTLYDFKIQLKRGTEATKTLTATADGTEFEFTVEAATTAGYTAGFYAFHAFVVLKSDATKITTIKVDVVEVKSDLSSVADGKTFALNMVEKIRAQLLILADQTFQQMGVDDKSFVIKPEVELRQQLKYWESEAGLRTTKQVNRKIKFTND